MGVHTPTPIQMQAISAILSRRDTLLSSPTGSGKSLAFLLPLLALALLPLPHMTNPHLTPTTLGSSPAPQDVRCVKRRRRRGGRRMGGVVAVVLVPSRELAVQHHKSIKNLLRGSAAETRCAEKVNMQDMSASLMHSPITISCAHTPMDNNGLTLTSSHVKQVVIWVEEKHKKTKLCDILCHPRHFRPPVLVFVSSRDGADLLSSTIHQLTGLEAASVHSGKPAPDRRNIIARLITGEIPVVVSTVGVLGRGVHIPKVSQVVVFDMPGSMEDYVHLIGRAGNVGAPGIAMAFVNKISRPLLPDLVGFLKSTANPIPRELAVLAPSTCAAGVAKFAKFANPAKSAKSAESIRKKSNHVIMVPNPASLAVATAAAHINPDASLSETVTKTGLNSVSSSSSPPFWSIDKRAKQFTLAVVCHDRKVLLGRKQRGFGKGLWMFFGGKVEPGEATEHAAARELQEEAGLVAEGLEKRAELLFHLDGQPKPWQVHVYIVERFTGEVCASDEMIPQWFSASDIPYGEMFPDDIIWVPCFLKGESLKAEFVSSADGMVMRQHQLTIQS
ncbi:unnamed protein product [Closterium sp. Yama58-4]|nr:unnamed protein product [Closterium sp. Yama58-4]